MAETEAVRGRPSRNRSLNKITAIIDMNGIAVISINLRNHIIPLFFLPELLPLYLV